MCSVYRYIDDEQTVIYTVLVMGLGLGMGVDGSANMYDVSI